MYRNNNSKNGRRQRRRLNEEQYHDRLSSFPDHILVEILSLLPINSAATTSVLSRRWRHLWTAVTRFELNSTHSEKTPYQILSIADNILSKLTSPKLNLIHLEIPEESYGLDSPDDTEPFFNQVLRRNLDQFVFDAGFWSIFNVPAVYTNSKSLVILKLIGLLNLELPDNVPIDLPNLKILNLVHLVNVPRCFQTMFKCCPLLEELLLSFDMVSVSKPEYTNTLVNIFAPNLKSLKMYMATRFCLQRVKIYIDTPKLTYLDIKDCDSIYYFVQNPTALMNASVDMMSTFSHEDCRDEIVDERGEEEIDYVQHMCRFVGGLYKVRNLKLMLHRCGNIFADLNSANLPIFSSLVYLETNCLKDLLHSLDCIPNLKHLKMNLWKGYGDFVTEQLNWCAPDIVPDCLVNKVKIIQLLGLQGIEDELKLIGYILHNATVLEKLCLRSDVVEMGGQDQLLKERRFCMSLFELPKSSSTCEVVFSGNYVSVTSRK